ncbi:MAG: hypothetical protein MJ182_01800 [Treponema sp.]|nr:hypothetical protein [Treponema sp.]
MIASKDDLLKQIKSEKRQDKNLFTSFFVEASFIDSEVCREAQNIFCSFDIPLNPSKKGDKLLFDKKNYASKANLLNNAGLIFGFCLYYAKDSGDSFKAFSDRFDFALNQYPNHVEFPQFDITPGENGEPKVSQIFSAQDIRKARDLSFAAKTFYSMGRAVPWFLSVLKPLRITPSAFFADFSEWQQVNNCDYKSGFNPEKESHEAIEKMQLLFLEQKYEEKNKADMFTLVSDVVRLNGAMSRLCDESSGKNPEIKLNTSYNPDDLFSEEILDLEYFFENVCMEESKVRLFVTDEGPDYEIK